jgi:hypothetical protein
LIFAFTLIAVLVLSAAVCIMQFFEYRRIDMEKRMARRLESLAPLSRGRRPR